METLSYRSITLIAFTIVSVVGFGIYLCSYSTRVTPEVGNTQQPEFDVLDLELRTRPKIAKKVISYGLFKRWRDTYFYDGVVRVDGRKCRLTSHGFEPVLAIRIANDTLLLGRDPYLSNRFAWFRLDGDSTFRPAQVEDLPECAWDLSFDDVLQTYFYRVWTLQGLVSSGSPAKGIEFFHQLSQEHPRFPFRKDGAPRGSWAKETGFIEFLNHSAVTSAGTGVLGDLKRLLFAAGRGDDPLLIAGLCSAIVNIDPEQGTRIVCEFQSSLPDRHDESDMRVIALGDYGLEPDGSDCGTELPNSSGE